MGEFFNFDKPSAQKIAKAVRQVLNGGARGGGIGANANTGVANVIGKLITRSGADDRTYAWHQGRLTAGGYEELDEDNRLSGTIDERPAIDLRDPASRSDLTTLYVELTRGVYNAAEGEETPDIKPCWFITAYYPESQGQYQWQQSTMVSANQRGWEFNRLHGLLDNS